MRSLDAGPRVPALVAGVAVLAGALLVWACTSGDPPPRPLAPSLVLANRRISVAQGSTVVEPVLVQSLSDEVSAINVSASTSSAGLSVRMTPTSFPAPARAQHRSELSITAAPGAPLGEFVVAVEAATVGVVPGNIVDTIFVTVQPPAAISLSMSGTSQSVTQGSAATLNWTLGRTSGYAGEVTLSVAGLPAGVSAQFSPASVTATGAQAGSLSLAASSSAAVGTTPLTVSASGSGVPTVSSTVSLTVLSAAAPSIALSTSPAALTVIAGQTAGSTVALTRAGGYTGDVTVAISGLPAGASAQFVPGTLTGTASSTALSITTLTSAAPGSYPLTLTATGPGVPNAVTPLTLTIAPIPAIAVTVAPTLLPVVAGANAAAVVSLTRSNFAGDVTLAATGLPAGVTASFAPAALTGIANTSTLTLSASGSAVAGAAAVTIRASGSGVNDATVALTVSVSNVTVATVSVEPAVVNLSTGAPRTLAAVPRDAGGQVLTGETVSWSTSNAAVATVSTSGVVTGVAEGTATITATVRGVSGSAAITVRTDRIALLLADQPASASYTPGADKQRNTLGAPLSVVRSATGRYQVSVPGFTDASAARVPFVNPVGAANASCWAAAWNFVAALPTVDVECKDLAGAYMDQAFAMLVMGANGMPGAHFFASTKGQSAIPGAPPVAFSTGAAVALECFGIPYDCATENSRYRLRANIGVSATTVVATLVAPLGGPTPQCVVPSYGASVGVVSIDVLCYSDITVARAPFAGLVLTEGRTGRRFGQGDNGVTATGAATAVASGSIAITSSGGTITTTRASAGNYRMTFAGLGRPAGGTELVLVTTRFLTSGARCLAAGWQTVGSDLQVDVRCFAPGGAPLDVSFQVLVIE